MSDPARRYVLIRDPGLGRSINGASIVLGPRDHLHEIVAERMARIGERLCIAAYEDGRVQMLTSREQADVSHILHAMDKEAA